MQTEREKKFWESVEFIKSTLAQGLLVRRDAYGRDDSVDTFIIQNTQSGVAYWNNNDCDRCNGPGGYHIRSDQHGLHIVEPIDIIKRTRETALQAYEEELKKATAKNQELEVARKNLQYWDDQLIKGKSE